MLTRAPGRAVFLTFLKILAITHRLVLGKSWISSLLTFLLLVKQKYKRLKSYPSIGQLVCDRITFVAIMAFYP